MKIVASSYRNFGLPIFSITRHQRVGGPNFRYLSAFSGNGGDHHDATAYSRRGRDAVRLLPSYLADARSVPRYDREKNPNGALQLGVAESLILEDWLIPALNWESSNTAIPSDAIYYQPTQGRLDFRTAMASYVEDLMGLANGRLKLDGLVVGAGCNAVLENLCFTLAEIGDTVLIPTPYYAAFEFDLVARAGLKVQPVTTMDFHSPENTMNPGAKYFPNAASLEAAYQRAIKSGSEPRILLISHPNNPLGICYPPSVVEECIAWCRMRRIHLISDEIYAGSIFRNESGFISALALADEPDKGLGPYVHWVYALSKDFALSGLRVGAVYTENENILLPLQKLNDLCQVWCIINFCSWSGTFVCVCVCL